MKTFVVFATVVACAFAKPQFIINGGFPFGHLGLGHHAVTYSATPTITYSAAPALTYSAPVVAAAPAIITPAFTKTQYHAQDELGQASYGYAHPGQFHAAVRDAFGNVRGSYAYIGADGKEVRTNYLADANGFQVESNALPVAPAVPVTEPLIAPSPVQDTPEVAAAKAEHQKAIEEAEKRNAEAEKKDAAEGVKTEAEEPKEQPQSRKKRGVLLASAPLVSTPVVHSVPALTYSSHVVHHGLPLTYAAVAAPAAVTYSAPAVVATPTVVAAPAVRAATLTKVVNTPGHAVSYRVD